MMRTRIGVLAIALALPAFGADADAEKMWVCSVGSTPGNSIILVSSGPRSYVKLSGQRVAAQLTQKDGDQRWSWGGNAIDLDSDGVAHYYEAGDGENAKGAFRCRLLK